MKAKFLVCISLIMCVLHFNLYSQNRNNLLPFSKNRLWGIMDTLGNEVLSPKYDNIHLTDYRNLAIFYQNSKQGLLDEKGKIIFEAKYRNIQMIDSVHILLEKDSMVSIYHIINGLIKEGTRESYKGVSTKIHAFREDSVFFIVNLSNSKTIWIPAEKIGNSFTINNLTYYYFYHKGKIGLFDNHSTIIFPPLYDEIIPQINFKKWIVKQNYEYGIFDIKGKVLQTPKFDRIEPNFGYFRVYQNKKIGIVDTLGRLVIPPKYEVIRKDFDYWYVEGDKKMGLIDSKYKELLPTVYESIIKKLNYWIVKKDGKFGVLNNQFGILINLEYDNIWLDDANYFCFVKDGNQGIKLKNGTTILKAMYPKSTMVDSITFIVQKNGKSAIYNENGLVSKWYSSIIPFPDQNYFSVSYNASSFGIIDRNGKTILPCENQSINMIYQKAFVLTQLKKQKLVSLKGENLSDWYQEIVALSEKYIKVKANNRWGVVDYSNQQIVSASYQKIKYNPICDLFLVTGFNQLIDLSNLDISRYYLSDLSLRSKYALNTVDTTEFFEPSPKKKALDSLSERRYKSLKLDTIRYYGYVNNKNELLLDTIFKSNQLIFDSELKQIRAETDTAMIVVSLEDDGSLIDKVHFKNWIKVQERGYQKKHHWEYEYTDTYKSMRWGLYDRDSVAAISPKFHTIFQPFMNDSSLTRTAINANYTIVDTKGFYVQNNTAMFGVVNTILGIELLPARYAEFILTDFANSRLARVISTSGSMEFIDRKFNRQKKVYRFIDDFKNGYTRVNFGGKFSWGYESTYSLEEASLVPTCLVSPAGLLHCSEGKWGIIDTSGAIIQPLKYDFIQREFRSQFIAQKNGKWGVLTRTFDTLIPFRYTEIQNFLDETLKRTWKDIPFYKARINKKWGVLNEKNQMIIPCKYDIIKYLGNQYGHFFGVATIIKKKAYWGLVNEKGDTIIPLKYETVSYLDNTIKQFFSCKIRQSMGYIDTTGNIFYDAAFEKAKSFSQNRAAVSQNGDTWNFIDKAGNFIFNQDFEQVHDFSEDLAAVCIDKWGFIDTLGNYPIDLKYIDAGDFHNGLAWVKTERKPLFFGLWKREPRCGYINRNGKFVIRAKYTVCSNFANGSAIVQTKKKSRVIDTCGKIIYRNNRKIVSVNNPYGWMLAKKENGEVQLINRKGEKLIVAKTLSIENFSSNGLGIIKVDGKYGIIDSLGKLIVKNQFDMIKPFCEGMARAKKGTLWGFINKDSVIIKPNYRSCSDFLNGVAQVKDPKRTFFINKDGVEIPKDSLSKFKMKFFIATQKNGRRIAVKLPKKVILNPNLILSKGEGNKYQLTTIKDSIPIIPCIFEDINSVSEGISCFSLKDKFWIYDSKGNPLNKYSFQSINKLYNESVFQLQSFDHYFYIKNDGTWIERK